MSVKSIAIQHYHNKVVVSLRTDIRWGSWKLWQRWRRDCTITPWLC